LNSRERKTAIRILKIHLWTEMTAMTPMTVLAALHRSRYQSNSKNASIPTTAEKWASAAIVAPNWLVYEFSWKVRTGMGTILMTDRADNFSDNDRLPRSSRHVARKLLGWKTEPLSLETGDSCS
jgi:hypothetical protein